jgi:hypothetical protein
LPSFLLDLPSLTRPRRQIDRRIVKYLTQKDTLLLFSPLTAGDLDDVPEIVDLLLAEDFTSFTVRPSDRRRTERATDRSSSSNPHSGAACASIETRSSTSVTSSPVGPASTTSRAELIDATTHSPLRLRLSSYTLGSPFLRLDDLLSGRLAAESQ